MKITTKLIAFLFLTTVLSACIEEFGNTGEAFNRQEQVVGTWSVTNMTQRDLLTDNPLIETSDITNIYSFEQYSLVLNADGSFSTSNPGQAPEFTLSNGSWAFDDATFPSAIILSSGANTSILDLGSVNSLTESNELQVTFTRSLLFPDGPDAGEEEDIKEAIAYEYTLSKSN